MTADPDLLRRAAYLIDLATKHDEVRIALSGVIARYEVRGVGELAEKHRDVFDLLESALVNMVEEVPWT